MKPFEPFILERNGAKLLLYPTPSVSDDFLEYGLLIVEEHNGVHRTLFNQVDTPLSDACIKKIQEIVPRIDVHLAMYASQDFGWFSSHSTDLAQNYTQNLYAAHKLHAKCVIPAAAGFRFVDRYQHLNQLLFPISEERFKRDLTRIAPKIQSLSIMPGDCLHIGEEVSLESQVADFVHLKEDDRQLLYHDPTTAIPGITDTNEQGYPLQHLHMFAEQVIGKGLFAYIQGAISQREESVMLYCAHEAIYQVKIILPDTSKVFNFVFSQEGCNM